MKIDEYHGIDKYNHVYRLKTGCMLGGSEYCKTRGYTLNINGKRKIYTINELIEIAKEVDSVVCILAYPAVRQFNGLLE